MVFVPNMIMKKAPNIRVLEPDEIQESLQNTPPHRARYWKGLATQYAVLVHSIAAPFIICPLN